MGEERKEGTRWVKGCISTSYKDSTLLIGKFTLLISKVRLLISKDEHAKFLIIT